MSVYLYTVCGSALFAYVVKLLRSHLSHEPSTYIFSDYGLYWKSTRENGKQRRGTGFDSVQKAVGGNTATDPDCILKMTDMQGHPDTQF